LIRKRERSQSIDVADCPCIRTLSHVLQVRFDPRDRCGEAIDFFAWRQLADFLQYGSFSRSFARRMGTLRRLATVARCVSMRTHKKNGTFEAGSAAAN
jgi:hypothetical protein